MTQINLILKEECISQVKTLPFSSHPVMNKDLLKAYRDVLTFSHVHQSLDFRNIRIYKDQYIHELFTTGNNNKLPHMVFIHGFGATSLAYLHMFQHLKDDFQVHALDLYGMGLSSRGDWNDDKTPEEVISYFIEAIEEWRKEVKLSSIILVGHSFGGYLAANYAEKYASRVQHLVFLSPAGMCQWTEEDIQQKVDQGNSYFKCFGRLGFNMNLRPTKMVVIPCLGDTILNNTLKNKLKLEEQELNAWKIYIKLISDQPEISEKGFYTLINWPDNPATRGIETILNNFAHTFPIDFYNGDEDWMSIKGATRLSQKYKNITLNIIKKAGHQLIFDNPQDVAAKMKEKVYKNR